MVENNINIGKVIQQILKGQGRSVTWLAQEINCTRAHLYKVFSKPDINTDILWRISRVMNVNFFQLYVDQWKGKKKKM